MKEEPTDTQDILMDFVVQNAEHLEKFAAAFVLQVGSARASEYQMVRQRSEDGLTHRWWFELRPVDPHTGP